MRVSYDREADAAYRSFLPRELPAEVASTYACDPQAVRGQIQLDFDAAGRLVGIEILDASRLLPEELLAAATAPR